MPLDEPTVAALVVTAIKGALAPLKERLVTLEARAALDVPIRADLTTMRERLAVLETRAPVPGPPGPPGLDGTEGLGLAVALEPLKAQLLTLEARAGLDLPIRADLTAIRERLAVLETRAPVPGPPGPPGQDGTDGLGFDDLGFEHDGARGFVLRFTRGDHVKRFPFSIPGIPIYRCTYMAGEPYTAGDVVTYGNQAWIAKTTTITKPGDGTHDWQLAVRKGADGKDGRPGDRGPAGPAGKDWTTTYDELHGKGR